MFTTARAPRRMLLGAGLLLFGLCAAACAEGQPLNDTATVDGTGGSAAWTSLAALQAPQATPTQPSSLWVRLSTGGADCQDSEQCADLVAIDIIVSVPGAGAASVPPSLPGTYQVAMSGAAATFDYFGLDDNCALLPPGDDYATSGTVNFGEVSTELGQTISGTFDVMVPLNGLHLTGSFSTPLCSIVVNQ